MEYRELVAELTIDKVKALLYRLGANKVIDKGDYLITNTICHNVDAEQASLKLYYYDNNKIFMCYSGDCGTMSIFKFLEHYYETRGIEWDWYNDIYEVVRDCTNFKQQEGFAPIRRESLESKYGKIKRQASLPAYNEGALDSFISYYPPEWLREGISKEAMDKFDIRYSISQNKIIIPHRDINGRLVGIRGRALNEWEVENVGKYMPVKLEETWYKHPLSMNLYGLYENKDNIKKEGICFVAEGEKSVLLSESFQRPNCTVAVCGSQFNKFQLNLLLKICHPQEIILCFDKEENYGAGALPYFRKLWEICQKYKNYANFSFIYDKEGELKLKEAPFDKGEEVFERLLNNRVITR